MDWYMYKYIVPLTLDYELLCSIWIKTDKKSLLSWFYYCQLTKRDIDTFELKIITFIFPCLMFWKVDIDIFNALSRFESQISSYKQDTCTESKIFDVLKAGVWFLSGSCFHMCCMNWCNIVVTKNFALGLRIDPGVIF